MRYIENSDLREWVKDSLRKAIFQKAHALAVQTGCEILVKLEDASDMFFATQRLQEAYRHQGVHHKPGEIQVSGETGAPFTPMVDMAVQSSDTMVPDPGGSISMSMPPSDSGIFMQDAFMEQLRSSKFGGKHRKSPACDDYNKRNGPGYEKDAASPRDVNDYSGSSAKKIKTDHHQRNQVTTPPSGSDANVTGSGGESSYGGQSKTPGESPKAAGESPYGSHLKNIKSSTSSPRLNLSPVPGKQFHCPLCRKKLKSAKSLQKHTKTVHPQELVSPASSLGHDIPASAAVSRAMPLDDTPAFTPSSPERYQCQKCDATFDCQEYLESHMKDYHKKLSSVHHTPETHSVSHKDTASPRKHTPKRNNVTPKRGNLTPSSDNVTPRRDEHSFSGLDHAGRRDKHTPKRDSLTPRHSSSTSGDVEELTPRHENHTSSRYNLTPKRDHTPRHDQTPRHDLTPKQTPTPNRDLTPIHNLADPTTPSLPSLGLSPQHSQSYDFVGSPTAPSNASSSPLSAPKTPGEIMPSQYPFENIDTHTSISDLPGSPGASQYNSESEPSRPNTPGDTPLLSYQFSDEIQTSIMNIPSISSPVDHVFSPPRSHSQIRSPDLSSPHRKQPAGKGNARSSDFKAAILSTPGPVVTAQSLQSNGSVRRHISRIQFESAIQGLQIADFGYVVPLTERDNNAVLVFVKKSPEEIREVWYERSADLGLCSLHEYREMYSMPAPCDISEHVKSQLIELEHVTEEQMNGRYRY